MDRMDDYESSDTGSSPVGGTMKEVEAYITFIDHCEEPSCGLGVAQVICPYCGISTSDYGSVWFNFNCVPYKNKAATECEHCRETIFLICKDNQYFAVLV